MKIALISQYHVTQSTGGTEYYVNMLCKGLVSAGHDVVYICQGNTNDLDIVVSGKLTSYFISKRIYSKQEIKQEIVSSTWKEIREILKQFQPDILHAHTYTTFFNIRHFEAAKLVCPHLVFTSHIPGNFCPQGDLICYNRLPCNGKLYSRCSLCLFTSSITEGISNLLHNNWQKVLKRLRGMAELNLQMVCVSNWQKQQAISNGFPADSIAVIRQAVTKTSFTFPANDLRGNQEGTPIIGFLGRLSFEKGADLLLSIIRYSIVNSNYCFRIATPASNSNERYVDQLQDIQKLWPERIVILRDVDSNNKHLFFDQIHFLLLTSFFIETGPIVLQESLLFNKPVIAPNLGGPAEFKQMCPAGVFTYAWNDLTSAMDAMNNAINRQEPGLTTAELPCEQDFISAHEQLYKASINKLTAG